MPSLFPTRGTLHDVFAPVTPTMRPVSESTPQARTPYQARTGLYNAWSTIDDAKNKTNQLSKEASAELHKAGDRAQGLVGKIELYSTKYYAACTIGGLMACGPTHTAVTPLDLVKCRRQVDPKMYKGNFEAWGKIARAEGFRGVFTGWGPTLIGYSAQGAFKYGGYEIFKKWYSDLAGAENAYRYKTSLYLAASASAEFIADIALCPFEAVKVRIQTTIPPFARGTFNGISKVTATEGWGG
ncbi:Mitochondrial phosphate carrier protein 3, mitochondrial [Trichoglossum hirsutum]|uniref:Mitochondrial phosphate carrier protein 3, mitochondrial n=1 Tax=Trichoglossum hirsutum TaxID=265104 RepID=A0A9P8LD40_9PEZI|nr:Mitochondrial phosphate carrier protein 3, mitochondrial [Trichoglossum hirsutum]